MQVLKANGIQVDEAEVQSAVNTPGLRNLLCGA